MQCTRISRKPIKLCCTDNRNIYLIFQRQKNDVCYDLININFLFIIFRASANIFATDEKWKFLKSVWLDGVSLNAKHAILYGSEKGEPISNAILNWILLYSWTERESSNLNFLCAPICSTSSQCSCRQMCNLWFYALDDSI